VGPGGPVRTWVVFVSAGASVGDSLRLSVKGGRMARLGLPSMLNVTN
jgi:hypothetical protein